MLTGVALGAYALECAAQLLLASVAQREDDNGGEKEEHAHAHEEEEAAACRLSFAQRLSGLALVVCAACMLAISAWRGGVALVLFWGANMMASSTKAPSSRASYYSKAAVGALGLAGLSWLLNLHDGTGSTPARPARTDANEPEDDAMGPVLFAWAHAMLSIDLLLAYVFETRERRRRPSSVWLQRAANGVVLAVLLGQWAGLESTARIGLRLRLYAQEGRCAPSAMTRLLLKTSSSAHPEQQRQQQRAWAYLLFLLPPLWTCASLAARRFFGMKRAPLLKHGDGDGNGEHNGDEEEEEKARALTAQLWGVFALVSACAMGLSASFDPRLRLALLGVHSVARWRRQLTFK